jgi:hypothetical protein
LGRTKGVHRKNYAARIDHEVHDRIVLEDLPPLPFAAVHFLCGAATIFGIGGSPLHLRYLLSAVIDIDAKFLAARLIRREPAACKGMSINTRRQGRSRYFGIPYRMISDSLVEMCRELLKKNMQKRVKRYGSPNGLPTGVRDELRGEAEGAVSRIGRGKRVVSAGRCKMRTFVALRL